jgi:thiol-disulfide isomerase/thioredoxin
VSTEKVDESEGERGGRWRGQNRTECGIHHHTSASDSEGLAQRAERVRQGYAWEQRALQRAKDLGVTQVTQETFAAEVADSPQAVLLDVYVPWCPHCRQFEPKFNEIATALRRKADEGHESAVLAMRFDAYENRIPDALKGLFPIDGYPTLFLVPPKMGSRPLKYTGSRTEAGVVVQWVHETLRKAANLQNAKTQAAFAP